MIQEIPIMIFSLLLQGKLKVFDFGLATEMNESRKITGSKTYLLTAQTGSLRYMAPEVFNNRPYNEKCDIYSFGVLLWQLIEMKCPFETYSSREIIKHFCNGAGTPALTSKMSLGVQEILSNCWLRKFEQRHASGYISAKLKSEINTMIFLK